MTQFLLYGSWWERNLAASFDFPLAITNKAATNSCGSGVHFMGMGFQLEQRKFSTYRLSTDAVGGLY